MSPSSDEQAALLAELRNRHLPAVVSSAPRLWTRSLAMGRRVSRRSLAAITRQLATLIGAGIPLARGLEIVTAQIGHRRLKAAFVMVGARVQAGAAFAEALSERPDLFDRLYVHLAQVGEQAGLLAAALDRLAVHLEQSEALRRKILSALLYPAIILIVAALSTLALLVNVIPLFAEMFRQSDVPLPGPTALVIAISDLAQNYWIGVLIGAGLSVCGLRALLSYPTGRLFFDRWSLRLPFIGSLLCHGAMARFTRSLGALLENGVPLLRALEATQGTLVNRHLEQAVDRARDGISQGESLAGALTGAPGWPALVAHLIHVGEASGRLDHVLSHLADYYTQETEHRIQTLTAALEPILIILVALLVGGLLVAMYLPIFNLNEVVS